MLAAKATRGWIDSHHLGDARVQSPGVCTQSVMSTVAIRSNLMGCQRTDTMDAQSDINEETENQRAELGVHQHSNTRGWNIRKFSLTPVAGPIFETKNRAIFLERFFGRGISGEALLPLQLCSH